MANRNFDNFEEDIDLLTEQVLYDVAEALLRYIEDSNVIPIDTHNLKDSTGIGVYRKGVLKKFLMPRKAQVPKIINGATVWGEDMINQMLDSGVRKYSDGDYIVLMSTMPYAEDVDKSSKHQGFFSEYLAGELEDTLDSIVRTYGRKLS